MLIGASRTLHAQTYIWDGGHPSQNRFSDNANWNPNSAPPNNGTANLVFTGNVRTTPDTNGAYNINSITFDSAAGAFTITGGPITLQGSGVTYALFNQDADTQTLSTNLVIGANQSWSAQSGNLTLNGSTLGLGANALTLTGSFNFDISNVISGTGSLTKSGAGIATLSGTNTYSGGTTISGGTLRGTTTSLQGNILNNATLNFLQSTNGTYSGVISGTGTLIKSGTGTVTLTGANSYSGSTTINTGTLQLGASGVIGDNSTVTLANTTGAVFAVNGFTETIGNLSGGGSSGGNVSLGAGSLSIGAANANATYSGIISGSGAIHKVGTGILTLTGTNTYSGATTISAGSLVVQNNAALGSTSGTTTVNSGATLEINGSGLSIAENLSLSGAGVSGNGALRNSGGDNTVSGNITLTANSTVSAATGTQLNQTGAISGSGGLTITGGGTVQLGGNNTYTGNTTVTDATLRIGSGGGNAIDGGNVILQSGGTLLLDADNRISGSTDLVLNGGTLQMNGNSLTLGSLTLTANSTIDFGGGDAVLDFVNGASGDWGGFTLTVTNWSGSLTGGGADILRFSGGISDSQAGRIVFQSPQQFPWDSVSGVIVNGNEIVPVPEPRFAAGTVLWLLFIFLQGWRRRPQATQLTQN